MGVPSGVDPSDLSQAGWGILFGRDVEPAVREALDPLLALRREQAARLYREGPELSPQPGESATSYLRRMGVGPGGTRPEKVPYYLLIVGDPESIPWSFQHGLDIQHAVGRLHFEEAEDYARYAATVRAAESGEISLPRRLGLFGVRNPDDPPTRLSCGRFLQRFVSRAVEHRPDWEVRESVAGYATRARLIEWLGGEEAPALLHAAAHGLGFDRGDPLQAAHQGALLCQEWPGPIAWGGRPVPPDYYVSGDDVGGDRPPRGRMAVLETSFSAGTPRRDEFAALAAGAPEELAPRSFVARLAQRLLSHPAGGALAVLGHAGRCWAYSFRWPDLGAPYAPVEEMLLRLMDGHRVGAAAEAASEAYASLASQLHNELENVTFGNSTHELALQTYWAIANDASNFVVLGDPAARLPLA